MMYNFSIPLKTQLRNAASQDVYTPCDVSRLAEERGFLATPHEILAYGVRNRLTITPAQYGILAASAAMSSQHYIPQENLETILTNIRAKKTALTIH